MKLECSTFLNNNVILCSRPIGKQKIRKKKRGGISWYRILASEKAAEFGEVSY
jgi:hypothetical protein